MNLTSPRFCLAAIAAALALAGCKKPAADSGETAAADSKPTAPGDAKERPAPVQRQEVEPNDTWQTAQALPDRAVVTGSFAPRKGKLDDDWYKLAPGPGVKAALHLELVAPAGGTVEVLDRDRNRLALQHAEAGAPISMRQVLCAEACFVKLSGASGSYSLTLLAEPPEANLELEPNDRAVDATLLTPGAPMSGTLSTAGDLDWYKLPLDAARPNQFVRIELSGVPGVRLGLEVRALDGTLLTELRGAADGEPIFVRDLAVTQPPPPPPFVPPASPLPAAAADAGAPLPADAGSASDGGDSADAGGAADAGDLADAADARAVPEDAGGATAVTADAGSATALTADAGNVTALPVDAGSVAAPTADAGPAPAAAPTAAAGYFLVVKSALVGKAKRGANPRAAYTLLAALETGPADLESEPNDDPQHATDLGPGLARSGYLAPAGDVDWYRVRADKPSVLHVELSALERADVELSIWTAPRAGEKQQLLARANEGGLREGEVLPAVGIPAGDSFIKIESALRELDGKKARDTEDRQTPYKLTAQLSPDDGTLEREPNDAARPQLATLPFTVKGFIWPRRDVDVFQFHVAEGQPPVTLHLSAVRGVDLQLELRQLAEGAKGPGETIGTADAIRGEGEESIVAVPLKPGDYQVEVSSPRHKDASATQPYTLTVQ